MRLQPRGRLFQNRTGRPHGAQGGFLMTAIAARRLSAITSTANGVGRRDLRESQPGQHRRSWSASSRRARRRTSSDAAEAAAAALPGWSAMNAPARGNILFKAADILDQRFDQVAADMTREEGKTLPEAKGEVRRVDQHPALLRRRRLAHAGHAGALRARSRPHVRHPQADRRGGPDHAVEFPQRDSGLEAGAGADLRQHGGAQAGVGRAAERVAHRRGAARSRAARRAW